VAIVSLQTRSSAAEYSGYLFNLAAATEAKRCVRAYGGEVNRGSKPSSRASDQNSGRIFMPTI